MLLATPAQNSASFFMLFVCVWPDLCYSR